jgi:hypothetical protein
VTWTLQTLAVPFCGTVALFVLEVPNTVPGPAVAATIKLDVPLPFPICNKPVDAVVPIPTLPYFKFILLALISRGM